MHAYICVSAYCYITILSRLCHAHANARTHALTYVDTHIHVHRARANQPTQNGPETQKQAKNPVPNPKNPPTDPLHPRARARARHLVHPPIDPDTPKHPRIRARERPHALANARTLASACMAPPSAPTLPTKTTSSPTTSVEPCEICGSCARWSPMLDARSVCVVLNRSIYSCQRCSVGSIDI